MGREKREEKEVWRWGFVFLKLLLATYIISAVLLLLGAYFVYTFYWPQRIAKIIVIATYVISNFAGGFLAGKRMASRKFLWGLGIGLGYFLVLAVLSILIQKNGVFGNEQSILALFLCLLSGMLGGMLS